MSASRQYIREVFDTARRLPKAERAAFLDGLAAEQGPVRAQVEDMLAALEEAGGFMSEPTINSSSEAPTLGNPAYPESGGLEASAAAPLHEAPGTRIGPYKLLQLIGEGGFGSVFMAEQERPVQRKVALKIIKLGMDTRQVVARFEQERQALAMMDHPNIARVLDAGATETGRPFFVMELVKGDPIVEYCDKNNLSIEDRLELFAQVCGAVQHAHTKGIIHRDIKPSNILVSTQDGRPHTRVIDFGIAKATASKLTEKTLFTEHRQLIGTPEYMSPEQAEGNLDIDTRTDVYSLGVLLYELLTGTTPFTSKELRSAAYAELQRIIREVEPPRPSTRLSSNIDTIASVAARRHTEPKRLGTVVRGELDWIVMKALEKDRHRRYETASGLAMDIQRYLRGEAIQAAPPGVGYRVKKFLRRNRVIVAAGSAVGAALLIGAVASAWQATLAREQRDLALAAQQAEAGERKRADTAKDEEVLARKRAETISSFVITALKAGDAQNAANGGGAGAASDAGQDVTILAAMDNAIADLDSARFKDDPETEAALRYTISIILRNNGRTADAEKLAAKSLEIRRRIHTGDHQAVALSLSNLATMRGELGRAAEAELLMTQSYDMYKRLYKSDHPDLARAMDNFARSRQATGHLSEARDLLEQALEMRKRLYQGDNADLATGMNNLALAEQDVGRNEKAEPLYQGALEMWKRLYKGDHPDIATGLNNLANVRLGLGRPADAEPLLVQALDMWKRLYKGDHEDVAAGLNALASVRRTLKRPAEAEPLQLQSLEMYQRLYKGDHPGVATGLSNLASVRQLLGRDEEAERLYAQALEMYLRLHKGDHPNVANAFGNLARARQTLGKTAEARVGFDQAVAMHRRLTPQGSLRLVRALWRSGSARMEGKNAGDAAAAVAELQEAATMAEKVLPADHPQIQECRETLAKAKAMLDEQGEARPGR